MLADRRSRARGRGGLFEPPTRSSTRLVSLSRGVRISYFVRVGTMPAAARGGAESARSPARSVQSGIPRSRGGARSRLGSHSFASDGAQADRSPAGGVQRRIEPLPLCSLLRELERTEDRGRLCTRARD